MLNFRRAIGRQSPDASDIPDGTSGFAARWPNADRWAPPRRPQRQKPRQDGWVWLLRPSPGRRRRRTPLARPMFAAPYRAKAGGGEADCGVATHGADIELH